MLIKIHVYLILMLAYMFAIQKLETFSLYYAFVLMHELAHVITALILKVDVIDITLLPIGVNAKYIEKISEIKELIISLAGPLASFLFTMLLKNKTFKSINLCIGVFNLIPIYPMDGGRILKCFFKIFLGEKIGKIISDNLSKFFLIALLVVSIAVASYMKNYYLFILTIYIFHISKEQIKEKRILEELLDFDSCNTV